MAVTHSKADGFQPRQVSATLAFNWNDCGIQFEDHSLLSCSLLGGMRIGATIESVCLSVDASRTFLKKFGVTDDDLTHFEIHSGNCPLLLLHTSMREGGLKLISDSGSPISAFGNTTQFSIKFSKSPQYTANFKFILYK